jgi:AraC-like DNA-binding protein
VLVPGAARYPPERFCDLNALPLRICVGEYSCELVAWGQIPAAPWRNQPHTHSFVEVCYAYTGRGRFRVGDAVHSVRAGDLFAARPGEVHQVVSSVDDPLAVYFWGYSLAPGSASVDRGDDRDELTELLAAFRAGGDAVTHDAGDVPGTIDLLTSEVARRSAGYRTAVDGLVRTLLIETARRFVGSPPSRSAAPAEPDDRDALLVRRMRRFLEDNYGRAVTVSDVAAEVHLSPRHAARVFRRGTGRTVMEQLRQLRLERASELLLDRSLSIKEVARSCGYPDVRYFTTTFRRAAGAPPGAFRRHRGTVMTLDDQARDGQGASW